MKTKIFASHRHPQDKDIKACLTHSYNDSYNKNIMLRFGLSSPYPQDSFPNFNWSYSTAIGEIDGIRIFFFLISNRIKNNEIGLWTYPDNKEGLEKFTGIFSLLNDFSKKPRGKMHK